MIFSGHLHVQINGQAGKKFGRHAGAEGTALAIRPPARIPLLLLLRLGLLLLLLLSLLTWLTAGSERSAAHFKAAVQGSPLLRHREPRLTVGAEFCCSRLGAAEAFVFLIGLNG